jgi:cysteinyl-tRNA synthetase
VLRLYDTASGTIRPLDQREPGKVTMYVCGPTVYGEPHLGNTRPPIVFDVLWRYLEFIGTTVQYVSNITDVDDKIIERARAEGRSDEDVAQEFEAVYWGIMDALGVRRPDETPHATKWIDEMVLLVTELIDIGIAYETPDGVYLSVENVDGYGLLAKQSLSSLRSGARVDVDEQKRSPLDFALWKAAKPGEPYWEAPFGAGRPGWHTECVVMSLGLLGEGFDLHGGGRDLAFPHHENERAQAVALGKRFAQHWVHNGWVETDGEKVSKSLGNFTSLTEMLAGSDARVYRLLFLRSHYRSPVEVTPENVADAEAALSRLDNLARRFGLDPGLGDLDARTALESGADEASIAEFEKKMEDDLDTPGAVALIFDLAKRANALGDNAEVLEAHRVASTAAILCGALGLELGSGDADAPEPELVDLLARRNAARATSNFAIADELRDEIRAKGWEIEDGSEGSRLRRP